MSPCTCPVCGTQLQAIVDTQISVTSTDPKPRIVTKVVQVILREEGK